MKLITGIVIFVALFMLIGLLWYIGDMVTSTTMDVVPDEYAEDSINDLIILGIIIFFVTIIISIGIAISMEVGGGN